MSTDGFPSFLFAEHCRKNTRRTWGFVIERTISGNVAYLVAMEEVVEEFGTTVLPMRLGE